MQKIPILIPGWTKDKIFYNIYLVDVEELSAFLPAAAVKKTENFYAAQTFIEGFKQGQNS